MKSAELRMHLPTRHAKNGMQAGSSLPEVDQPLAESGSVSAVPLATSALGAGRGGDSSGHRGLRARRCRNRTDVPEASRDGHDSLSQFAASISRPYRAAQAEPVSGGVADRLAIVTLRRFTIVREEFCGRPGIAWVERTRALVRSTFTANRFR